MGITSDSTRDFCDGKVLYIHGDSYKNLHMSKLHTCK